jgi:CRP-like cAMP-binding protein
MPDTRTIRQLVEERIAEIEAKLGPLRAEQEQLRRALDRDGLPPRRPRPKAASTAGDGTRSHQAVGLIGDRPGITAAQLADAMGVSRNYLYRVLPKLQRSGVLAKRGAGYEVV